MPLGEPACQPNQIPGLQQLQLEPEAAGRVSAEPGAHTAIWYFQLFANPEISPSNCLIFCIRSFI